MADISQTIYSNACIFLNEHVWISNTNLLLLIKQFVPKGTIDNYTTLVQIMAWRRAGEKLFIWTIVGAEWRIYMRQQTKPMS